MSANTSIKSPKLLNFPVSTSNFESLVKKDDSGQPVYCYVDKSLFIQDFLKSLERVSLITRPRRFGKSTNFDMLAWFLDIRRKQESKKLFEGLKIETATLSNGKSCMDYHGKYPVVFMSFKTLGQSSYEEFYGMFQCLVINLYKEHRYLLDSESLKEEEKNHIYKAINEEFEDRHYKEALKHLMNYLHRHFGERVVVLIDEYDTPFQQAIHQRLQTKNNLEVSGDYLDALKTIMGAFLGDALKDNKDLEACMMTGIIRIAGAGIFSQLNNVDVLTVLDEKFAEHFGFTQAEVDELLCKMGRTDQSKAFSDWYNGYEFGGQVIYNPLSVIKCLDRNKFGSYWLDTSNNLLIRDSLLKPRNARDSAEINEAVAAWVSGKAIEKTLSEHLVFDNNLNELEHLWILLLSSGYLKASPESVTLNKMDCKLRIPNQEVLCLYRDIFSAWLNEWVGCEDSPMIQHLLNGNAEGFCQALQTFFKTVISVRDVSESAIKKQGDAKYEAFYHGFMVGILGLSMSRFHATLRSNGESGYGYYDLVLLPKDSQHARYNKAVILEFKRASENEILEKSADKGLQQIIMREYQANILESNIKEVVLIAVAFRGKQLAYRYTRRS